jgi:hypothetical protein
MVENADTRARVRLVFLIEKKNDFGIIVLIQRSWRRFNEEKASGVCMFCGFSSVLHG